MVTAFTSRASTAARRSTSRDAGRLWVGYPLTLLWYLGMMNAINFLDGLDGLLAGVTAISGLFLFAIAIGHGHAGRRRWFLRAGRRRARFLAVQLQSGQDHSGRHRARFSSATCSRRSRSSVDGEGRGRRSACSSRWSRSALPVVDTAAAICAPHARRQVDRRSRSRPLPSHLDLSLRPQRAAGGPA